MTSGLHAHLLAMSDAQLEKLNRDSIRELRRAWPHRHTSGRAPIVIRANLAMIRNLRSVAPW